MALEIDPDDLASLRNLEIFCQAKGDYEAARVYCEKGLAVNEAKHGINHADVATSLNNLGILLVALNDLAAARDCFERAYDIDAAGFGADQPRPARDLYNLGVVLERLGDDAQGRKHMQAAIQILLKHVGEGHSFIQTMRRGDLLQME